MYACVTQTSRYAAWPLSVMEICVCVSVCLCLCVTASDVMMSDVSIKQALVTCIACHASSSFSFIQAAHAVCHHHSVN